MAMRIIAGRAKGKKILPPEDMVTRPTLDRVKENIFNIIQNRVVDAVAVDVFAGTGSLGLESVSRGAKQCYLIDRYPVTFKRLQQNVKDLKFENECTCLNMDSYAALKDFAKKNKIFDLIFIDPPYAKEMIPPAIEIISQEKLLHEDGLIVCKIDSSEEIYQGNDDIVLVQDRRYGNTTVCFYAYKED
ncbi:16S rRNA (guanine(966)-N(2))-methyltransferase RsmD [Clostridium botulinum]|nr:putative methyltransferase [Clostridium botulinum BKT015925]NFF30639.1 16S rRNA (guanine(966)-N(2))-methyltransferase RsmD [Clostridium botulinum]NFF59930.1 16S rRNA (guanine(966)-N(2))-methyltransferase RsmD [Clostridium botulinum]NFL02464.1 16S rRNA (guanine(966)-N(2))-methyltransferase RsmD [Clostridium botulinum]NFQ89204.1 16S rRNA (guanine(966)-N(2))-methyltransferase RsmD [Clostridium botulinum]